LKVLQVRRESRVRWACPVLPVRKDPPEQKEQRVRLALRALKVLLDLRVLLERSGLRAHKGLLAP
jgi:hypothetical protein